MRIRYYVLSKGQQFEVYRESVAKSAHVLRGRAIEAATTMARLETRFTGAPTEVAIETIQGHFMPGGRFDPPPKLDADQPPIATLQSANSQAGC
jgi:hypothetical protein